MKANAMSNFEIVTREDFSDVTYLLEVRHPLMAKAAKPGQFVIVMLNEHGERIPLTIADFDREQGHHHAGDPGGRQDDQADAAGMQGRHLALRHGRPDGHPQPRSATRRRSCASAAASASRRSFRRRAASRRAGAYVIGVLGFRNKDLVFWEDKFRACLRRTHPLHRRRLGRHEGPGHRRHQAARSTGTPTSTRWSPSARRS